MLCHLPNAESSGLLRPPEDAFSRTSCTMLLSGTLYDPSDNELSNEHKLSKSPQWCRWTKEEQGFCIAMFVMSTYGLSSLNRSFRAICDDGIPVSF